MDSVISKVFTRVLLTDVIKISPKLLQKTVKNTITEKLKEKVEGKCTKHGYIKNDSIEIFKITPGKIETISLNGYIQYSIQFYADVCNPLIGSLVKCTVKNINKFGILAVAGIQTDTGFINVMHIIIAKNSVNINSDIDLEKLNIGDDIIVEILGKKYELNDDKISVVGKVVKDIESSKKKKKEMDTIFVDDDDEADDIAEEGEDDEEEEEEDDKDEEEEEDEDEDEDEDEEEEDDDKSKNGGKRMNFFSDDDESVLSGGCAEDLSELAESEGCDSTGFFSD